MIDFNKTLIRASSISKLMTEPKDKATKDAGGLSQTAKTHLKEVYISELWGLSKEIRNKFCDKGKAVEDDAITLLTRMDKRMYMKNEERINDDYFTGIPDVFNGEDIRNAEYLIDAKSSWDAWTFIAKMGEELDREWWSQMQIYLHLCKCDHGEISVCLISTPQNLIEEEKRRLFYQMNAGTELNPDYISAVNELEAASNFDEIPIEHRRIRFPVQKDEDFIEKCKQKVIKAREYLKELHEIHVEKTFA